MCTHALLPGTKTNLTTVNRSIKRFTWLIPSRMGLIFLNIRLAIKFLFSDLFLSFISMYRFFQNSTGRNISLSSL